MCADLYPTCLALRCGQCAHWPGSTHLNCKLHNFILFFSLLLEPFYLWPSVDIVKISSGGGIRLWWSTIFQVWSYICSLHEEACIRRLWSFRPMFCLHQMWLRDISPILRLGLDMSQKPYHTHCTCQICSLCPFLSLFRMPKDSRNIIPGDMFYRAHSRELWCHGLPWAGGIRNKSDSSQCNFS